MSNQDISLMAHLMRRAGFTATRDELEEYVAMGYEATIDDLLYPGDAAWQISEIDTLDGLTFGFVGARNITSVAVGHRWQAVGGLLG